MIEQCKFMVKKSLSTEDSYDIVSVYSYSRKTWLKTYIFISRFCLIMPSVSPIMVTRLFSSLYCVRKIELLF